MNCAATFVLFKLTSDSIISFHLANPAVKHYSTTDMTKYSRLSLITSASCETLVLFFPSQTFVNPHYQGSLIPTYIILSIMAAWAYLCAGGSLRNLKLCLTCKDKDFLLANHRPR